MLRLTSTSFIFIFAVALHAAGVAGVVKDPSGAVVAGAAVVASNTSSKAVQQSVTDAQGRFRFENLSTGAYTITVTREGFETWEHKLTVAANPIDLPVALKLLTVSTSISVSARRSPLANSDPNYQALRGGKLHQVFRVQNLVLTRDAGTLTFRSGSFSFMPPVLGRVTTGVFVGEGSFHLTPAFDMAAKHLRRIASVDAVDEEFTAMVVYFSDSTFDEVRAHSELADESNQPHADALKRVREVIEHRREPPSPLFRGARPNPLTMLERLLNYEDIPNYEAEVLAEIYNSQPGSFRAILHGRKHGDLRFLVNPTGSMPMLSAPEEVAVLNFDPSSESDGIWYLSHFKHEVERGLASSNEDKRLIVPENYKLDVWIGKDNLFGKESGIGVSCELRFHSLADSTRMVKFDLVPDMQVTRVMWNGKEIPFIQESRKQDGSFYLQMPEALVKGAVYKVSFEYAGDEIVRSTWGVPPPRRAWYPRPHGGTSYATFDMTFRTPHNTSIVATGKQVKHGPDGPFDVSVWTTPAPIQIAAFKYLTDVFDKTIVDEPTNIQLGVFYDASITRGIIPPSRGDVLIDAGNSVRVFKAWFGPPAYDSINVLVSPSVDSLPGMVYANAVVLAGFNSLQTQAIVATAGRRGRGGGASGGGGGIPGTARTFLDEAFPREMSRQWWGNTVSSVSFHDQWLSAGFANFSTSLYDLAAYLKPEEFRDHWVRARELIVRNNPFGIRPNDVGPIWMGITNDSFKTSGIGNLLNVYKGGYVLHMLRCLMYDATTHDKDFREMMQDYVKTFANRAVSTEDFKWMVEKHMKPAMDLEQNRKMDWFFREWVYGTELPSYKLEYSIVSDKGGKPALAGKLTQSGVSQAFQMAVPIYGEFDGRNILIGSMEMHGNTTGEFKTQLPKLPKKVLLNANHDVLYDKQEVKQIK